MRFLVILSSLLLAAEAASAATRIRVVQDKPAKVIMSFARGSARFHYDDYTTTTFAWNWATTNGGSASVVMLPDGPQDGLNFYYEDYYTWNTNGLGPYQIWQVIYRGNNEPDRQLIESGTNSFGGFPWEIGALRNFYDPPWGFLSRDSRVSVQLITGGKSGSKLKHLFALPVSATEYNRLTLALDEVTPVPTDGSPVSPFDIEVPGATWVDTNGMAYAIFPDDSVVDITPKVGVRYYSFAIDANKYKSHFTAFVNMPDPDGYNIEVSGDYGHAWWSFTTEAPANGINRFMGPQLSQFIGLQTGYYPSNSADFFTLVGVFPGLFQLNDTSHTAHVSPTYEIGFPALINGLQYSLSLSNSPGTWSALTHNCVHATRAAGSAVGIELPYAIFPEDLGNALKGRF